MKVTFFLVIFLILLFSRTISFGQCNPMPKADFTAEPFCETDSAIFVNLSLNAESYLWKFGDGLTSKEKSPKHFYHNYHWGYVTLVARDSNGCADSITKLAIMNSNPNSDFTFTIKQNEVTFKAKQVGSTIYQWYFGNGDSSLTNTVAYIYTYNKSVNDSVCLKVTNAAKCFSKTCKEFNLMVSVSQIGIENSFKIYPSPSSGNFKIENVGTYEVLNLEIINQLGQTIHQAELQGNINSIDLNLDNGVYQIRATSGEYIFSQRIVISK